MTGRKIVPLYDRTDGKSDLIGEAEVEIVDGDLVVHGIVSQEFSGIYGMSVSGILPDFPEAYEPINLFKE